MPPSPDSADWRRSRSAGPLAGNTPRRAERLWMSSAVAPRQPRAPIPSGLQGLPHVPRFLFSFLFSLSLHAAEPPCTDDVYDRVTDDYYFTASSPAAATSTTPAARTSPTRWRSSPTCSSAGAQDLEPDRQDVPAARNEMRRLLRPGCPGNITCMALRKKQATTIALDPDLDRLLTRAARDQGISRSEFIRQQLRWVLEQYRKHPRPRSAGIIRHPLPQRGDESELFR